MPQPHLCCQIAALAMISESKEATHSNQYLGELVTEALDTVDPTKETIAQVTKVFWERRRE